MFALLACSDALGLWKRSDHSKVYFLSAIHLAHLATAHAELTSSGEMKGPDKPWSLYGGIAGMCCAWAEVYERLCRSKIVSFSVVLCSDCFKALQGETSTS